MTRLSMTWVRTACTNRIGVQGVDMLDCLALAHKTQIFSAVKKLKLDGPFFKRQYFLLYVAE